MISLIPCYSLEDFSLFRKASEVDEIFSAWSALYHPALIDRFGEAPHWEAAGSPSTGKLRRLVVIPPCAEYLVSRSWIKSAEAEGALVIRHLSDRDAILQEAFEKLGIDPTPRIDQIVPTDARPSENAPTSEEAKRAVPYDDVAETFMSAGLGCLLEELLTRKLRYMSNLDQISFNTRLVDASRAHMDGRTEEREKNLQKAFDLLTQSKEYFFPTATKFLELIWVHEEDLKSDLFDALKRRQLRNESSNLIIPLQVLKTCEKKYPDLLQFIKFEIEAKRVSVIGGDEWEAPFYLMSPLEIIRLLRNGRELYQRILGCAPTLFARQEAGYAQILPQLLKGAGYKAVLARTGDGWTLLDKKTDRTQFRWQGRDGSAIMALCKEPLDASNAEGLLQIPDKIGSSYYSDENAALFFEHRPNKASRWMGDLLRMNQYSPVLGRFLSITDFLRETEGSGNTEKFVKDQFKTNFLTRSVKRSRENPVSLWPQRRRLGQALSALSTLETTVRFFSFKTRKNARKDAERAFEKFIQSSQNLRKEVESVLRSLDSSLLLPTTTSDKETTLEFSSQYQNLEERIQEHLDNASKFLLVPLESAKATKENDDVPAQWDKGFLILNASSSRQTLLWEIKRTTDDLEKYNVAINEYTDFIKEKFTAFSGVQLRSFSDPKSSLTRFAVSIPSGLSLWIPQIAEGTIHFIARSFFEIEEKPVSLLVDDSPASTQSPNALVPSHTKTKKSLIQKFAQKLRGSESNSPSKSGEEEEENRTHELVEYVERRYSPTEFERYYSLKNDYIELRIDPTTGSVRRLTTYKSNAVFTNGVLRQPSLGNRFAWDLAMKLPEELRRLDSRSDTDSYYGYTIPAADRFEIISSGPGIGRLLIEGRMMTPAGEIAASFKQTLSIRLKSRVVDVDVEIDPQTTPNGSPWDSYYACRFAWKDALADIRGGVAASLIGTARDYLQAPECVDIRSEDSIGITILSAGLPFYKKVNDSRIDGILIPSGETRRRFRFGVGVDLEDPHSEALSYSDIPPFILGNLPSPRRIATQFLTVANANISILETSPLIESSDANSNSSQRDEKLNDSFTGVQITLLETHSAETETTLRSLLPIKRVEAVNYLGDVTKEIIDVKNGSTIPLKFNPRQMRMLRLYF
ncbi:MAG: hypothetical protein ACI4NP_06195 [Thermoguttaceae bacterium]